MTATVLYDIFTHCQSFLSDSFWSDKFYLCACGRFPDGFVYDHLNHTVQYDGDTVVLTDDPCEIIATLKPLFQKSGIRSYYDLLVMDGDSTREMAEEWKDVKPKSLRDRLITDYITELCIEKGFTKKIARMVIAKVNMAFKIKTLISDDIVFEEGKVVSINSLKIKGDSKCGVTLRFKRGVQRCTKHDKTKSTRRIERTIDKYSKTLSGTII